ncbi:DNA helicase [Trifolium repens]|nr:DNA helicase [Trifolium repens]
MDPVTLRWYVFKQRRYYRKQQLINKRLTARNVKVKHRVRRGLKLSKAGTSALKHKTIGGYNESIMDQEIVSYDVRYCAACADTNSKIFREAEVIAYGDIGDMESTCVDCGALIWFQERANKDRGKLVIKLYIYDTQNEIANRLSHFSSTDSQHTLDPGLVKDILDIMDTCNVLVKSFRMVRDYIQQDEMVPVALRLFRDGKHDPRTYNVPHLDEVAALVVGDIGDGEDGRDIVVRKRDGRLKRLHETHRKVIASMYTIEFQKRGLPHAHIFAMVGFS